MDNWYEHLPTRVRAIQWNGNNIDEIKKFISEKEIAWSTSSDYRDRITFGIWTLEGKAEVRIGAWLIRGLKGELYCCADDVFKVSYKQCGWKLKELEGSYGSI